MTEAESLLSLVRKLYPFNWGIVGSGSHEGNCVLQSLLPFVVHEWESGDEVNGWLVPKEVRINNFTIEENNQTILDGRESPLHVPSSATSFSGTVGLPELREHLLTDPRRPTAVPWAWQGPYRPDEPSEWLISASHNFLNALTGKRFRVDLDVESVPSSMQVCEYTLPGETDETILLNAHNCHPYQANDDVSGIAVGIAVMNRLRQESNRRLTYTLLIAPEITGPVFWMEHRKRPSRISGAIMLKSLGNPAPLKLQDAFDSQSLVNRSAHYAFSERYRNYVSGPFRGIYGNDETVFEAPPFRIPSISATRWPFPEYHTDLDKPERLSEEHLRDAANVVFRICELLEMGGHVYPAGRGLHSLSRHGLYRSLPMGDGLTSADYASEEGRWHRLMNTLPSHFGDTFDLLSIAQEFDLPPDEVHDYVKRWIEVGLASKQHSEE